MGAALRFALLFGRGFGWAGNRGLAAFERWIENDPRVSA